MVREPDGVSTLAVAVNSPAGPLSGAAVAGAIQAKPAVARSHRRIKLPVFEVMIVHLRFRQCYRRRPAMPIGPWYLGGRPLIGGGAARHLRPGFRLPAREVAFPA